MRHEVEALEQFFAAINRNDMQAITKDFDPDIVRVEPEGFPTAGTYRGIAQVREHVAAGRGTWAEGTCEPEEFFVNGDKVVVYLVVHVRLKDATDWIDGRFADGFVFRDGTITEYRTFGDRQDALAWAGVTTRLASCSCGQLSARVAGDPVRVSMCHCLACQRRTGSMFGVQARFPRENVAVAGKSTTFTRTGDAGGRATFHFCPQCGATVYYEAQGLEPFLTIPAGAFADPTFPAPTVSVYEERMHGWVVPPPDAEHIH
jgi:ketosteroid isomerase-like protein